MNRTGLDPSLAFTAMHGLMPAFGRLTRPQYEECRDALLAAWYGQEKIANLWAFAATWLAAHRCQTCGLELPLAPPQDIEPMWHDKCGPPPHLQPQGESA